MQSQVIRWKLIKLVKKSRNTMNLSLAVLHSWREWNMHNASMTIKWCLRSLKTCNIKCYRLFSHKLPPQITIHQNLSLKCLLKLKKGYKWTIKAPKMPRLKRLIISVKVIGLKWTTSILLTQPEVSHKWHKRFLQVFKKTDLQWLKIGSVETCSQNQMKSFPSILSLCLKVPIKIRINF